MKKFICTLIIAVMLISILPFTFAAAAELTYPAIELGKKVDISLSRTVLEKDFTFTAPAEGEYAFYTEGDADTYGYLYNSDDEIEMVDDDGALEFNFMITRYFEKGEKAHIKTTLYNVAGTGSFKLGVNKIGPATSIVTDADTYDVVVGESVYVEYDFAPYGAFYEDITYVVEKPEVVAFDEDAGELFATKAGTTKITLKSESGLTKTVTVNVYGANKLELDKTFVSKKSTERSFTFTPAQSGYYTVELNSVGYAEAYISAPSAEGTYDVYYLEKGEEYPIYVDFGYDYFGYDITVRKAKPADDGYMSASWDAISVGSTLGVYINDLNGYIDGDVEWSVDKPDVAVINETDNTSASVTLVKEGVVKVSAKVNGTTLWTVIESLKENVVTTTKSYTQKVYAQEFVFAKFKAPEDGWYRIYANDSLGNQTYVSVPLAGDAYDYFDIYCEKDESFSLFAYRSDYDFETQSDLTIKAVKLVPVTDAAFAYDTINIAKSQYISLELVPSVKDSYFEDEIFWDVETEAYDYELNHYGVNIADFCTYEEGEYIVTATCGEITDTLKIIVGETPEVVPNKKYSVDIKSYDKTLVYNFTPSKTVVYKVENNADRVESWSNHVNPYEVSNDTYAFIAGIEYKISFEPYHASGKLEFILNNAAVPTKFLTPKYIFALEGEFVTADIYTDGDYDDYVSKITVADTAVAEVLKGEYGALALLAKKAGETVLTLESDSGVKGSTILVVLPKNYEFADDIDLNKYELTLDIGKSEQLTLTTTPKINGKAYWSSADESIARVDENGRVTAITEGTTTIQVMAGGCFAECEVTTVKPAVVDSSKTFTDIKAGKWYTKAVDYAYSYGFIAGVSNTEFGLNQPVTRGMFITILARIAGVDTSSAANKAATTKFTDVKTGKYYTAAIKWASENKIVNGITDTTFAPNSAIERQQLCVMIVNFAKYMNVDLKASEAAITFTDASKFAKYAKTAIATCQTADIVNGYSVSGGYEFRPKNTATRGEAAQILYKFHKDFVMK